MHIWIFNVDGEVIELASKVDQVLLQSCLYRYQVLISVVNC